MASLFEIGKIPKKYRIDESRDGSNYKNFVLPMSLDAQYSTHVLYSKSKIIFKRRRGEQFVEIDCKPYGDYIDKSKDLEFYFPITPETYNKIESIRIGGDLEVYLSIEEMFLLPFQMPDQVRRPAPNIITKVYQDAFGPDRQFRSMIIKYDTTTCEDCKLDIFGTDWAEEVIEPLGMGERFIIEIPCKFPDISDEVPGYEDIKDLKERLVKGIELLRSFIDEYNKSRDPDKCVYHVRKATDNLQNIPDKKRKYDVYGEYLIEISKTGSKNISNELITHIFNLNSLINNISSKGPHETTRKTMEPMEYYPQQEDAELLLHITSLIYYWMAKKLERSAIEIKAESEIEDETEEA